MVKRPSILKQDDLKELDELDHDGDEGWAGENKKQILSHRYKITCKYQRVGYGEPVRDPNV